MALKVVLLASFAFFSCFDLCSVTVTMDDRLAFSPLVQRWRSSMRAGPSLCAGPSVSVVSTKAFSRSRLTMRLSRNGF